MLLHHWNPFSNKRGHSAILSGLLDKSPVALPKEDLKKIEEFVWLLGVGVPLGKAKRMIGLYGLKYSQKISSDALDIIEEISETHRINKHLVMENPAKQGA